MAYDESPFSSLLREGVWKGRTLKVSNPMQGISAFVTSAQPCYLPKSPLPTLIHSLLLLTEPLKGETLILFFFHADYGQDQL